MFKLLFIGYLFGIRSERQLIREVQVNVAYRWFLSLGLTDKVPNVSTLSTNRTRRFKESDVYQQIFDQIVLQAMKRKLVGGYTFYTDTTHLKANAHKKYFEKVLVEQSRQARLSSLQFKQSDLPSVFQETSLYNQPKIDEDHHTSCLGG
jgi:transposase